MNKEQGLKLVDLDCLIGNHYLQMMKATLPYIEAPEQRMLSVPVEMSEPQRTIPLFRDEEVAAAGTCSLEHQNEKSPVEVLKTIKPYASAAEQETTELVSEFLRGRRTSMANMLRNFGGFDGKDALFSAAQLFGQQGQGQTSPVMSEEEIPSSGIPSSEIPDLSPQHNSSSTVSGTVGSYLMLDRVEGLLSPEQQSRIEMVQMVMRIVQQLT